MYDGTAHRTPTPVVPKPSILCPLSREGWNCPLKRTQDSAHRCLPGPEYFVEMLLCHRNGAMGGECQVCNTQLRNLLTPITQLLATAQQIGDQQTEAKSRLGGTSIREKDLDAQVHVLHRHPLTPFLADSGHMCPVGANRASFLPKHTVHGC